MKKGLIIISFLLLFLIFNIINNNFKKMTTEKTDKEEYDMAKHFKETYEKMAKKIQSLERQNFEYKKILMMSYSFIRLIDESPSELCQEHLIEVVRGFMSELIDEHIFKIEPEEIFIP